MASSSHPLDQVRKSSRKEEEEEEEKKRGTDWLELGLGFSSGCKKQQATTPASNPSSPLHHQQIGLGLGLGLGVDYSNPCVGFDYKEEEEDLHNHDDMPNSWQMDSSRFIDCRQMRPVLNHTHDYYYYYNNNTTRPHLGFWFTLRSTSTTTRNGEAVVLPQIPKAYIRVKDENVMVLMVKKYLVRKLGLSNEAEVEISCMEQKLWQWQTLKHVRDSVWLPRMRLINSSTTTTTTMLLETASLTEYYLLPLHYYRNTDVPLPSRCNP